MAKKTRRAKARRALLALSLVLVTMLVTVGGTIAWLTASSTEVLNTFAATDVGVTLVESDDLDLDMVPGSTIRKDPKATVTAGSEDSWLFVKITKNATYDSYLEEYEVTNDWALLETYSDGLEKVYYYKSNEATPTAGTAYQILKDNQVKVSTEVTKTMMENIKNGTTAAPTLTLQAYVCQKANVADAATAWSYIGNNGKTPTTNTGDGE